MRICYLNGEFVTEDKATISVFDRGFLFSDSVYEVSLVLNGKLVDNRGHLARLTRSLNKLDIPAPYSSEEIIALQQQIIEKNQLVNGSIYLQVTRGNDGDRDFLASAQIKPSFMLIPQFNDFTQSPQAEKGISVMSFPEIRWAKRDIKTTGLLGAVLAKKSATEKGYDDAWFVEDGYVTEGTSNNAYIIKGKEIITKPTDGAILAGITRQSVTQLAHEHGLTLVERAFTIEEAQQADEAFITSAGALVTPVIAIDDVPVADGKPGALSLQLRQYYIDAALGNLLL